MLKESNWLQLLLIDKYSNNSSYIFWSSYMENVNNTIGFMWLVCWYLLLWYVHITIDCKATYNYDKNWYSSFTLPVVPSHPLCSPSVRRYSKKNLSVLFIFKTSWSRPVPFGFWTACLLPACNYYSFWIQLDKFLALNNQWWQHIVHLLWFRQYT